VAKNHNFGQIFGGSLTDPLLPIRAILVCYSRPKVYTYTPNFIWMCSLCQLPVAKTTILGKFWHFGGSCTDPLLPMRTKFGVL